MFLSERVIVPHSSYSMTEALALEKESFSLISLALPNYILETMARDWL